MSEKVEEQNKKPEEEMQPEEPNQNPETQQEANNLQDELNPLSQETSYECNIFNLNYKTTEDELNEFISKYAKVISVSIEKNENGDSKGLGSCKFESQEEKNKILSLKPEELILGDRKIKFVEKRVSCPYTIYINNLNYKTTEEQLKELFKECGENFTIRIAKDRYGKSKGFAHIDFSNDEEVEKALKMSGKELDERKIFVEKSIQKSNIPRGRPFSRSGFRGGRGGRGSSFRPRGRGGRGSFSGRYYRYDDHRYYDRKDSYDRRREEGRHRRSRDHSRRERSRDKQYKKDHERRSSHFHEDK